MRGISAREIDDELNDIRRAINYVKYQKLVYQFKGTELESKHNMNRDVAWSENMPPALYKEKRFRINETE